MQFFLANLRKDKNRVDHLDKYAADKYRRDSRRDKSSALSEFPELKDYKPNIQVNFKEIYSNLIVIFSIA